MNGRASGPVLQSVFLAVIDHIASSFSFLTFVQFALVLLDHVFTIRTALSAVHEAGFTVEQRPLFVLEELDLEIAQGSVAADALKGVGRGMRVRRVARVWPKAVFSCWWNEERVSFLTLRHPSCMGSFSHLRASS